MRAFTCAVSLLAAFILYPLWPSLRALLADSLRALHARVLARFTGKDGAQQERPALCVFLLLLAGAAAIPGAFHPLLGALAAAPVYCGLASLPGCVRAKAELDSGAYARDHAGYEALVRKTCADLAPAFSADVFVPLLLVALGTPLYLGASLGWCCLALRALCDTSADARRLCALALRPADAVFRFLLSLLSGLLGRNPLLVRGRRSRERLMYILGIAGEHDDTHAPMAGDITQAVFLCCFSAVLFAVVLTLVLAVL